VSLKDKRWSSFHWTKKQAKHLCAQQALSSFVQFRDANDGTFVNALANNPMPYGYPYSGYGNMMDIDFTSDEIHVSSSPSLETKFEEKLQSDTEYKVTNAIAGYKRTSEDLTVESEIDSSVNYLPPVKKSKSCSMQPSYVDKNPVMILNELRTGLKYECTESGDTPTTKRFIMIVNVDGEKYEGSGASKKMAKHACARAALTKLYNMSFTPHMPGRSVASSAEDNLTKDDIVPGTTVPESEFSLPQEIADKIGRMVMNKFEKLISGHAQHSRRKVLAGIVMSLDGDKMEDLRIICVSTGTKCVNGEHMSVNGNSLNDCHAEIVSRRCLLEFLYKQIEKFENGKPLPSSIFEPNIEQGMLKGYKLKEKVRFHLYINTAPCGDARIFSPHESSYSNKGESENNTRTTKVTNYKDVPQSSTQLETTQGEIGSSANSALTGATDRHPNRKARGQLRTKIESGEGTIPVKSSDGIQTWDGVMQGSRLLTMSCSDKILRWNVLGIQGALLSMIIEPIHLYSITLGSLFHPHHMFRAVVGRIQSTLSNVSNEKVSIKIPRLNLLSSPEVRQPGKAPNYSVNWTTSIDNFDVQIDNTNDDNELEIIDAMKGKKQETGIPSRLAKASFFKRFIEILKDPSISLRGCSENNASQSNSEEEDGKSISTENNSEKRKELCSRLNQYCTAKEAATEFQNNKKILLEAFKAEQLGTWVKKPMEQDEFTLEGSSEG